MQDQPDLTPPIPPQDPHTAETQASSPEKQEKPFVAPPVEKPPRIIAGVDLDKVLLPKKEQLPETRMRVNAGEVLKASTPAPAPPKTPATPEALQMLAKDIRQAVDEKRAESSAQQTGSPAPAQAAPTETAPKKPDDVASVRTYKGDIEETVREQNVSMVSIAAAQARRSRGQEAPQEEPLSISWRRYAMYGGGALLALGAISLLAFVFTRGNAPKTPAGQAALPSLIYVDAGIPVSVSAGETGSDLLAKLQQAREQVHLALGLVERVYIMQPASSTLSGVEEPYPASALLALIAPHIPQTLPRAFNDAYILGIHSFDGNQPFFIFKTSAYQQVYAGMLEWESFMLSDLSPLFVRTPRPHIPEEGTTTPIASPQVTQTPFVDAVVENHDARIIENSAGDILLLWTFVDRETLVIATNEYSLREAITRLKNPPVVSIPGQ